MDERDFKIITILDQTKSITATADRLFISQSALSKRIKALEEELDIILLIRSRLGIHFTPEGETILRDVQEASLVLSNMRLSLANSKNIVSGTLKIGVSINYSEIMFPDILSEFINKYPNVKAHITSDQSRNLYQQLQRNMLDMVIIRGEYNWNEGKRLLSRENVCLINSQPLTNQQMHTFPYITRSSDSEFERLVSLWIQQQSIHPTSSKVDVDNMTTCVKLVKKGIGWSIVPEICLSDFTGYSTPLKFSTGEPFTRSTYLLYRNNALELPQYKAFVEFIKEEIK